jgi:hypothetical protein
LITTLEQIMPESAPPNPELLRSLGRLVRGLSALFWALPIALVVCVQTAMVEMLHSFNVLPPMIVTGWIVYGLWQLGHFQKQERIWIHALDRAKILALVNFGFSPFLYWWNQRPGENWFGIVIGLMAFNGLLFLSSLNLVLCRLAAMLPDEVLREETRQFTSLNRLLLLGIVLLGIVSLALLRYPTALLAPLGIVMLLATNQLWIWLLVVLSLLPLAMTMALIWKIKEVILGSVFGAEH